MQINGELLFKFAFCLWIEHLDWWEALRCNKSLGWINWWWLQWWHQYIEQLRLEPVQISMSAEVRKSMHCSPVYAHSQGDKYLSCRRAQSIYGSLPKINVWIFPILQCQQHWFWATGVGPVLIVGHNFLSKRHPAFVSFMLDMNGACAVLWSILKCKYKCIA